MGVLDEIKPKFKVPAPGGMVAELVAKGEAEIGFQQVAELVNKPGVAYIGALPEEPAGHHRLFRGGARPLERARRRARIPALHRVAGA